MRHVEDLQTIQILDVAAQRGQLVVRQVERGERGQVVDAAGEARGADAGEVELCQGLRERVGGGEGVCQCGGEM